jgi:RNA polymerase sigma-70 factor (ECF subfamily)
MTDYRKIIKKIQRNDKEVMVQIYEEFKNELFMAALKYSRNREDANDVLQDGFITIFKTCGSFKHQGSFEGWMKKIVIYTAINKYKETEKLQMSINETLLREVYVEDETLSSIPLDILLDYIQKLPHQYRLVFNLYEMDGHSHKDIAELLKISQGTSKSNLFRAKKLLQKQINSYRNESLKTKSK